MSSSRRALSRVFLTPTSTSQAPGTFSQLSRTRNDRFRTSQNAFESRCFATTPTRARRRVDAEEAEQQTLREAQIDPRYTTDQYMEKTGRDRLPRDYEITDPLIMVLEGNAIEGPLNTKFVMTRLKSNESLRMAKPYKPRDPKTGDPVEYALCKIVDKLEDYKAAKEAKEKKKLKAKPKTKEVELSWGISENDLQTKLQVLGGFLEKGIKVEIAIGKKKKGKEVELSDCKTVLKAIRKEIESKGGFEPKEASGELGETMRLSVQKKPSK